MYCGESEHFKLNSEYYIQNMGTQNETDKPEGKKFSNPLPNINQNNPLYFQRMIKEKAILGLTQIERELSYKTKCQKGFIIIKEIFLKCSKFIEENIRKLLTMRKSKFKIIKNNLQINDYRQFIFKGEKLLNMLDTIKIISINDLKDYYPLISEKLDIVKEKKNPINLEESQLSRCTNQTFLNYLKNYKQILDKLYKLEGSNGEQISKTYKIIIRTSNNFYTEILIKNELTSKLLNEFIKIVMDHSQNNQTTYNFKSFIKKHRNFIEHATNLRKKGKVKYQLQSSNKKELLGK